MKVLEVFLHETVSLWMDMAPYLLLGMFIAGMLHLVMREDFISRHLGQSSPAAVLKATLLGIPLPLCSCGVIPVAASLRRDGASKGATMAFLVSTPTTGVDSVLATYSLLGPLFALFRPLAAFMSGLVVGGLSLLVEGDGKEMVKRAALRPLGIGSRLKGALRYGFVDLAREIGGWLLFGVLVGGAISTVLPKGFLRGLGVHPALEALALLGVSVPLYVCATGSIPVAAALIAKGVSPGGALVFLVAGPATNTVTLTFVYSQMGRRALYLYLGSITAISLALGWGLNHLWHSLGSPADLIAPAGKTLPQWMRAAAGVVLLGVILLGRLRKEEGETSEVRCTFYVPDMSCSHCKARIEEVLRQLPGVEGVVVDLKGRTVGIMGEVDSREVEEALKEAGYPPASAG